MINLLMICPSLGSGGIEKLISQWEPAAKRNGIRFVFGVYVEGGTLYEEYKIKGYSIYHLRQIKNTGVRGFSKQINEIVRTENIDIIHLNVGSLSWLTLRAAMKAGVGSRIAHAHTNKYNLPENKMISSLMLPFIRLLNRHYSTIQIGCSKEAADYCFGKSKKNVVVHNGVDIGAFSYSEEKRNAIRNEFGIPLDVPVLGFIGRLSEQKNPFFAIEVYQKLLTRLPQTEFLIVGDGELRKDVEDNVRIKGLRKVHFAGAKKDIAGYYSAMDFSIMPSLYEGLLIVAVEAQAAALPLLVSTNVPQEVAITRLIQRMDLTAPIDSWADCLEKMFIEHDRQISYCNVLKSNGYDCEDSINTMIKIYLTEISRFR